MNSITPPPASVLGFYAQPSKQRPFHVPPLSGCPSRMAPEIGGEAPAEATAAATQVTDNTRPGTYEPRSLGKQRDPRDQCGHEQLCKQTEITHNAGKPLL